MPDRNKMSVEEILAYCRQADGPGGGASADGAEVEAAEPDAAVAAPQEPAAEEPAAEEPAAKKAPAKPAAAGKKPNEMSVAEMLAAARAEKGGATSAADSESAEPAEAAGEQAAPEQAAPKKKATEMSVAEMLAAARGEKSKPKAAKPAAKAKPAAAKAKPAPAKGKGKPAAAKGATKASPEKKGPRDTGSILAAARKSDKAGPMSRAEAAAKGKPVADKPAKGKQKLAVPPMPAKPEYARPAARPAARASGDDATRRGFFAGVANVLVASPLAVGFASLAVTHLLWVLGLARFMFPNILTEPPTQFKVGFPDEYAPGQVETKFKAQFGVWIVRYEYEGLPQIFALKSVCTHLGCTPNWLEGEQKFKCPCHGSGFYKDGVNFEGPAPRPLERYAVSLADDGQLEVDKSRKFQEELGQWSDTASFVEI